MKVVFVVLFPAPGIRSTPSGPKMPPAVPRGFYFCSRIISILKLPVLWETIIIYYN